MAGAVGGASAGAAATAVANQAAASAASQSSTTTTTTPTPTPTSGGSGAPTTTTTTTPPPVSVGSSGSSSAGGAAAVQAALSQLGVPYAWGGETAGQGFDCSGLTQWAWAQAGVSIPRTAAGQWASLPHVSLSALQPGDLLFYTNLDGDHIVDHVVMYVGSGPYGSQTVVHAPYTGSTVSYSPIWTTDLIGAGRP